ncbi:peptide ABC transporter substrate-binding protein [bacterium]|jgi:peptide/nickel transport system substrate-binding protein|nr:peptide ABC transporter substrate-binding protein [bacterium]MBT4251595.1 peptide ABC transporter substrate-binding protein [bacterium]MBT4597644.1 peptide ABC transporter substrate-binding protein [bacterium]MBT6753657.1 peptide ABC transporter substrate-binding protein [bacterium]MBT7037794.1 peptide ABC transporter substrate-binding protein [bacterium]
MSKQLRFSFPDQLKNFGSVLSKKEKFFLYLAVLILVGSLLTWSLKYYISSTQEVPAIGGEYTEGVIGQPSYINPVLAPTNETDLAISRLIFSSLMTYDNNGALIKDLAKDYRIEDDGKKYIFDIKQGVKWHDDTELTAQDIAFTIEIIKNKLYNAPLVLRGDWQDISVNVENDYVLSFTLKEPSASFLNKTTFGVLPHHIFDNITSDKFRLSEFNLKPVGSGPFAFAHYEQDDEGNVISYQLLANSNYHGGRPYLEKINFDFYADKESLYEAYKKKEVNGLTALPYEEVANFSQRNDTDIHVLKTSQYFATYFNQTKSIPLASIEVRKALLYATNKQEIIDGFFKGYASAVFSPIIPDFGDFTTTQSEKYPFDQAKAEELLENSGWKKQEDGTRKKEEEILKISLTVHSEYPSYTKTAEFLKSQWEQVGVQVEISLLGELEFQNAITPREYQAVLYGQPYIGNDPDPFFFWHSSRKKNPGQNFALYENEEVDKLLIDARGNISLEERKVKYAEFEEKMLNDAPALFICSPQFVYITNTKIKGDETSAIVNLSYRFSDINKWYIKTVRERR